MTDSVTCIVLAGGLGTRLRHALPDVPKCLAPVGDRSFLEIQLDALCAQGVNRFVLALGHLSDQVIKTTEAVLSGLDVRCVVEPRPLGTGGAILQVLDRLDVEESLVVNGDTFLAAALDPMLSPLDRASGEIMRVATITVADRTRYGGVRLIHDRVAGFVEKGASGPGLINAGLYRLARPAFEGFEAGASFSLETEVMPRLALRRELTAATLRGRFVDIGVPDDYRQFCADPPRQMRIR